MRIGVLLWPAYFVFVPAALHLNWHHRLLSLAEPLAAVKVSLWVANAAFLAFSLHCSAKEEVLSGLARVVAHPWGRQVGADLYVGLGLFLLLVSLHEGPMIALAWTLPTILFGNLSPLLYVSIHFDSIVGRFAT